MIPSLLAAALVAAFAPIPLERQERDPLQSEEVSDEAAATARGFCAALRGLDDAALLQQLAPGFTARGLSAEPLDGPGLARALRARFEGDAILRRCAFKPIAFTTDRTHREAVARLWLNLGGTGRNGVRFGDLGDVEAQLQRVDGKLRFAALELAPRRRTDSAGLRFSDVAKEIGLDPDFPERGEALRQLFGGLDNGGISVADVDGDGALDIYVVRNGGNLLYRNDGHGHFTDVTAGSGAGQIGPYTSVVAADVDGDGLIDLYVAAYHAPHGLPAPSVLDAHNGTPNLLLHNLGKLRFEEIGQRVGVAGKEWSLAAAFADLDGDHKPELVVVNDYGSPRLYRNDSAPGKVRFTEVTRAAGLLDVGNGMGVDIGDVDGDGLPDVHLSKMYSTAGNRLLSQAIQGDRTWLARAREAAQGDSLFHNDGHLHFTEVGASAGIRRAGWAWSCELGDLDNDGDLDLYVANGFHTGQREDEL